MNTYRKKLIEVALPLEAINAESAREKSIRHGHPSTLHLWWARRPLAACRAVLWSSLVDDPSEYMPDEESANAERERLFAVLEELVKWENVNNEEVLDKAKLEIARSVARDLGVEVPVGKAAIREFLATQAPPVLDPFAGGGSIPLEAQRLGLRPYASDLNPVAVLINKALIEIPPKFAGMPPVHPLESPDLSAKAGRGAQKKGSPTGQGELWQREWKGAEGLAEDVRYYGKWMRDEAEKRIGHLYPPVKITEEMLAEREDLRQQGLKAGDELTVIAWLWARTVKCPNPACGCQMPLVHSFVLVNKNRRRIWIEPKIIQTTGAQQIEYEIKADLHGRIPDPTVVRSGSHCIACGTPVQFDYISSEGQKGKISYQMIGIAADGKRGRVYLPPNRGHINTAISVDPEWLPESYLPQQALGFRVQRYGMHQHSQLFMSRQIVALTMFSDLVKEARERIIRDNNALQEPVSKDFHFAYADAVSTYLALAVSKTVNRSSALAPWMPSVECPGHIFSRQAISMNWDFAEANILNGPSGSFASMLHNTAIGLEVININDPVQGIAYQANAITEDERIISPLVSTDPPYYDNIGYADLSDLFYIWLRRSVGDLYKDLFRTLLTPKSDELIADQFRQGNKENAQSFFENGLAKFFNRIRRQSGDYPFTVYYAFRQSEVHEENEDENSEDALTASTGWETMLESLIDTGFSISGTWPMRTEREARSRNLKSNALASSIVLVCRQRSGEASVITRRELLSLLKLELSAALHQLQLGNIAPVDLAQAAIGPGMAIFSRYKQVFEADGTPMRVRTALGLINQSLDEYLAEQEGEYDGDTRWALAWFEQYGHEAGPYGVAETLSKAKNTSVEGLAQAGFLEARSGKVRLLRRAELDAQWEPGKDKRLTAWEACQHLIRELDEHGEQGAGALLGQLGALGETARDLAYRLYTVCERKGWAQEALAYNMLVVAWPRIKEQAGKSARQERLL